MNSVWMLITKILYPSGFAGGVAGVALLGLRIFVGLAFLKHGFGKWQDLAGFAAEFSIPQWLAALAASSQILGAIALIAGMATPIAAMTIGGNMIVAVGKLIGRGEPFINPHGHSWESAGFYALAGIVIYALGPGVLAVDHKLLGSRRMVGT